MCNKFYNRCSGFKITLIIRFLSTTQAKEGVAVFYNEQEITVCVID